MARGKYVDNIRQMRIVYTISALAVIIAIVLIVVAAVVGAQVNPAPPENNGLNNLQSTYNSSDKPMRPGAFLLSSNKTKMLLFTDNLYVIQLSTTVGKTSPVLWSATATPIFPYSSFLTLSSTGKLDIQILNETGTVVILWSNNIQTGKEDSYRLQVTDNGQAQVLNLAGDVTWSST